MNAKIAAFLPSVRLVRILLFCVVAAATLIGLFFAEENWRAERAWQAHAQALAARGESLDPLKFMQPPIPDAENFAKTPLLESIAYQPKEKRTDAFARLAGLIALSFTRRPVDFPAWLASVRKQIPPSQLPSPTGSTIKDVMAILQPLDPDIEELLEAARAHPRGQFDDVFFQNGKRDISLDELFRLAKEIDFHAMVVLRAGQTARAFDEAWLMHRLADAIQNHGTLLGMLVAAAIDKMGVGIFAEGWSDQKWTVNQYELFRHQLASCNLPAGSNHLLRFVRAWQDDRSLHDDSLLYRRNHFEFFIPRGWIVQHLIVSDDIIQQLIDAGFDEKPPRYRADKFAAVKEHADRMKKDHDGPFVANICKFAAQFARAQMFIDEAEIVCALEEFRFAHGSYPESLSALPGDLPGDIFSGQAFIYRKTGDGSFLLYSVGENQKDEAGYGDDIAWAVPLH